MSAQLSRAFRKKECEKEKLKEKLYFFDEIIIEMMNEKDWVFKEKEGSGLFFEKQGEELIVTTEKWTSNYSLVDIPMKFDE